MIDPAGVDWRCDLSLSSGDNYWQPISLAEAGFSNDLGERLDSVARNGELDNLHAVLVVRHGRLVFERYYEGPDERWFRSLGTIKFAPDVKHDIRSISKSVVGLLYGIAFQLLAAPMSPVENQLAELCHIAGAHPKAAACCGDTVGASDPLRIRDAHGVEQHIADVGLQGLAGAVRN